MTNLESAFERQDIYIERALRLFLKFGVKSVTIGHIAQALNISTKTIYKFFGDKTGLVRECLRLDNLIIARTYQKILEKENVLLALLDFYNELVNRIARVNPNYFKDIQQYFPEIWHETTTTSTAHIRTILDRGVGQGYFNPDLDTHLAAETIGLLIKATMDEEAFTARVPDRRLLSAQVIYPYIRGICTARGWEELRRQLP
ncbi:MAG: TetR/AcrR family transcriptional regulator [Microscillaceae bacterium]